MLWADARRKANKEEKCEEEGLLKVRRRKSLALFNLYCIISRQRGGDPQVPLLCYLELQKMNEHAEKGQKNRQLRKLSAKKNEEVKCPVRRAFLLINILWVMHGSAFAGQPDASFGGSFETGVRRAADDFVEEDLDTQYSYHNTRLKALYNDEERTSVSAGAAHNEKKYKYAGTLNNKTDQYTARLSRNLRPGAEEAWAAGAALAYRNKRFENRPTGNYKRGSVAPFVTKSRKKLYRCSLGAGLTQYDYEYNKRKNKKTYSGTAEGSRYLLGGKLTLMSSLKGKVDVRKKPLERREKAEFMGKADYRMGLPLVRRAALRVNLAKMSTKDEDERDIDYDYRYQGIQATTYHEVTDKIDADFSVESTRKNYLGDYPGHTMWRAENGWERALMKNERDRWKAGLDVEFKKVNFEAPAADYTRKSLSLSTDYTRKGKWKAGLGAEARRYNYTNERDKTTYYAGLLFERKMLSGRLAASAELKYRLSRHETQGDREQKAIKAGLEYGW